MNIVCPESLREIFTECVRQEGRVLASYKGELTQLPDIVELVVSCKGKVVLSGVGKSGIVARKVAASLSSTGTPSFFLHPVEAMHGDLGSMNSEDILIAISYSGNSGELDNLLKHARRLKIRSVAISSNNEGSFVSKADYYLPIPKVGEICPINVAPTTSTTMTMAMGDALVVCLMKYRNFGEEDFASFHPGGNIGRDLFVKIKEVMIRSNLPILREDATLREAVLTISEGMLGNALFVDSDNKLKAVLSDGDLRRSMMQDNFDLNSKAIRFATTNPQVIYSEEMLARDALEIIKDKKIQMLVVASADGTIKGILHLHSLISLGFRP